MRRWLLAVLALPSISGRRYHDNRKHRHAHTFLQLCTDGDGVHPQACVEKVDNKWPKPAVLAPLKCKVPARIVLLLQIRELITGSLRPLLL